MVTHQQTALADDPATTFKMRVERFRKKLNIPGLSLAVLHRQQILFAEGFGYANLESKITATPATPYNLASLTKPFAAAVLLKLEEEGRLDLDTGLNFPRNSGHRVKPQAEKFRIPAALHNQARSDVFFCCRRFQYSKTGC